MSNIILPDWYEREYVDVELLFMDYFTWLPIDVKIYSWLPQGYYDPLSDDKGTEPTLRIWRMPGTRDTELRSDEALVQIAAISRSAADSWELIEFCQSMMDVVDGKKFGIPRLDDDGVPTGERQRVNECRVFTGPQQVPEIMDEKMVPMTWRLSIRGKRLLPDYRQILENLAP